MTPSSATDRTAPLTTTHSDTTPKITSSNTAAISEATEGASALQAPVDARGIALTVLAVIAFVFALQLAKDFFVPVILAIFLAYTLNPLVNWLERIKVPRLVGATLLVLGMMGSGVMIATSVYGQVQSIVDELPFTTFKLTTALKRLNNGELSPIEKIQSAADALRKAAMPADEPADAKPGGTPAPRTGAASAAQEPPPPTVIIQQPDFKLSDWLWAGSVGAATFLGQVTIVLLLVLFLLASGDTFKRKLVKLTGPSLTNKKITVHILDDINMSIQKYMFMLLVTNILLTILMWAALHFLGIQNAGAWAIASGFLHIVPYLGTVITVVGVAFVAFLQFESFSMLFLVAAVTAAISTVVGMLVATWMTGRIAKMNTTAVFIGLLFGGWLWGIWGMLLCVPIIVVIRVIAERVEGMQTIAELLGE
jgi:predicted PurR-regulated permease PerM